MSKRGASGGNGKVANLTLRILREIRDEIRTLRSELNVRIDQTNVRLGRLEDRFDHFLQTAGREVADLRGRVASSSAGWSGSKSAERT